MTAFIDLDGEILSQVPGADVIQLERSIRRAVRYFCEKTLLLEATTNPYLDVVADQAVYTLPAVDNRQIIRAKRDEVWWGDTHRLTHRSADQLSRDEGSPDRYIVSSRHDTFAATAVGAYREPWQELTGAEATVFFQPTKTTIRLVPIPTSGYSEKLGVTYHLKPSFTATEVDDFIVNDWYEVLVHGAIGDLLQVRQKPWTDIRLGHGIWQEFEAKCAEVAAERVSGFASNDYATGRVRAWP